MTQDDRQPHSSVETSGDAPRTDQLLREPQIAIVLPPTDDGASFKAWQHHLSFACSAELIHPDDAPAFHASTSLYILGPFIVSLSTSSHLNHLVRTGKDAVRTGVDHVNISLHLEGDYRGRCGNRPFHARQGDISFIDFGMPFDFETTAYRTLALTVPRSALPDALRQRSIHGLVPDPGLPATGLLAQLMRGAHAALPGLTLGQGIATAAAIVELAVAASQGDHGPREELTPADLDLFSRAQMHIERSLGDFGLTVASLTRALDTTRGALYRAFGEHGGVQAYISERRIQRCYEVIHGNDRPNETLGTIAFSFGFRSEAHFSRAFKDRFGVAPRELRAIARQRSVQMLPPTTIGMAPDRVQNLGR